MFRYHDLLGPTWLCLRCVLRHNDLTREFLLALLDRHRMLRYDNLSCSAWPRRGYMLGYHGLIGVFRFCGGYVLRHDDLLRMTRPRRGYIPRHDDLLGLSRRDPISATLDLPLVKL
jgi:hypothetical protein